MTGKSIARWVIVMILCLTAIALVASYGSAQDGWTFETETTVGATAQNQTWHGVGVTDDGVLHHVWQAGNNVWTWDGFGTLKCQTCDLPPNQRQTEPRITARGQDVLAAWSDRMPGTMHVITLANGKRGAGSDITQSTYWPRPFFTDGRRAAIAFTGYFNEDAMLSEVAFTPLPVRRDVQISTPSGGRQSHACGAWGGSGVVEVWQDLDKGGLLVGALEGGSPRFVSNQWGEDPHMVFAPNRFFVAWHGQGIWLRVLGPRGRPLGIPIKCNTSDEGLVRDPHLVMAGNELVVSWERVIGLQRRVEFRVLRRDGTWAVPERPVHPGLDPIPNVSGVDWRGCHAPAYLDGRVYFPLSRWRGDRFNATVATWTRN